MFQSYIKGSFLSIFRPVFKVDKKSLDSSKVEFYGLCERSFGLRLKKIKDEIFCLF